MKMNATKCGTKFKFHIVVEDNIGQLQYNVVRFVKNGLNYMTWIDGNGSCQAVRQRLI